MFASVARARRRARTRPPRSPFTSVMPGALDRDVGAGAHRDPHLRGRERGRVVDAVAGHRDDLALGLQAAHHLGLALRQHVRLDPVDPDRAGDDLRGGRGCRPSASRSRGPPARSARIASAASGLTGSAAETSATQAPSTASSTTLRASRALGVGERVEGGDVDARRDEKGGGPEHEPAALDAAAHSPPRLGGEVRDRRQREAALAGRPRRSPTRAGARCPARGSPPGAAPRRRRRRTGRRRAQGAAGPR